MAGVQHLTRLCVDRGQAQGAPAVECTDAAPTSVACHVDYRTVLHNSLVVVLQDSDDEGGVPGAKGGGRPPPISRDQLKEVRSGRSEELGADGHVS